jgi:CPA2 family monovalent cation:H+ antiporter-2
MHHLDLILTLTGGLAAALGLGFVMHRLGLSPVVGYLLAGVVVGPRTPGFVANELLASELAEIGVILLMFGVGVQFHFRELVSVRRLAIPGALGQILAATGLGALAAYFWGWSSTAGLIFGIAISVASTVVLVRVLSDHKQLHTATGRTAVGWLVLEDLFTVLVLVVLPLLLAPPASGKGSLAVSLGLSALKLVAFGAVMFFVGRKVIPRLFQYAAETRSRELFTLTVLVSALGIAVGAAKLFGASMALGAFLAGMIVGQSEFSARAASEALPMRDAFAVLFFVSVGMLFDPVHLVEHPGQVAVTLAIVLVGKPLVAWLIMRALGAPNRQANGVSIALAQIGEFSFLLASTAQAYDALPKDAASTLVAASIVSIAVNPVLYRLIEARQTRLTGALPADHAEESSHGLSAAGAESRAIIVGHGPTGKTLANILRDNRFSPVVVDLNIETIQRLRDAGTSGVHGDAVKTEVLEEAGIASAAAIFLTSASLEGATEVIRVAKQLNPGIRIYVRTDYMSNVASLDRAGAGVVISAEGEVALAMATTLLENLGATPDQIDRERDRVHRDLREQAGLDNSHSASMAGMTSTGATSSPSYVRPKR